MSNPQPEIVVVGSMDPNAPAEAGDEDKSPDPIGSMVEEPAKVMRIGTMVKQLLEEVKAAPLDEAGRRRMREIHSASIRELEDGLAPELREELRRLTLPFGDEEVPSEAELRIAQAQLVGWLEGVFHGIQTAILARQMTLRGPEGLRLRALPQSPEEESDGEGDHRATGQYL